MLRRFTLIIFLFSCIRLQAQDSSRLRISLLTCTPGDELYSTFGHSALRVTDSTGMQDIVFNYGTFNFDEPDFYMQFIRGKLRYFVSTAYFTEFRDEYQATQRGITEQVLQLSGEEKLAIWRFLLNNIREENKYYQYDFLFDNCTTRLRDIIVQHLRVKPAFTPIVPAGTTYRNAIHAYLRRGDKSWSQLGIDILLGAPTDGVMTAYSAQFLPDNLMGALDSSNHRNRLVAAKSNLYPFEPLNITPSWFNPLMLSSLLLLLIILLDLSRRNWAAAFLYGFDGLVFFLAGATGCILVFMWVGTDHQMCRNNYNLLWALPTHAVFAFFLHRRTKAVKRYYRFTAWSTLALLAAWAWLPQELNPALIPLCLLILYRSIRNARSY